MRSKTGSLVKFILSINNRYIVVRDYQKQSETNGSPLRLFQFIIEN